MAKRKHPNLPNGFGQIRHLSGNRTNPYGVYPPAKEKDQDGNPITPKALCYVNDWYVGFAVLTAYKAGKYIPGMELEFLEMNRNTGNMNGLARQVLSIVNQIDGAKRAAGMTFIELYHQFMDWKFNGKQKFSDSTKRSYINASKNCKNLHDRVYIELTYRDFQDTLDECTLGFGSIDDIRTLFIQMAKYAQAEGVIENRNSVGMLIVNAEKPKKKGNPFMEDELKILWNNSDNDTVKYMLIMCYAGFRVGELKVINVDLENRAFYGGIKTDAGVGRTVPIHDCILPIVTEFENKGKLMAPTGKTMLERMEKTLNQLGINRRTPHDCRHTFSMLCERYGVRENDRKRLMGHSFQDVTNAVYGHRTLEDLRGEISKIPSLL